MILQKSKVITTTKTIEQRAEKTAIIKAFLTITVGCPNLALKYDVWE